MTSAQKLGPRACRTRACRSRMPAAGMMEKTVGATAGALGAFGTPFVAGAATRALVLEQVDARGFSDAIFDLLEACG